MIKALIATVATDEPTEVAEARRDQAVELQEIQSAPRPPSFANTLPLYQPTALLFDSPRSLTRALPPRAAVSCAAALHSVSVRAAQF